MKIYRANGSRDRTEGGEGERFSFSLDHGHRISCFDSGSPIRGELCFVGLAAEFSKVEQRGARKRIAKNRQRGSFPFRLFEFVERVRFCLFSGPWGRLREEGEASCTCMRERALARFGERGGRLRALVS